MKGTERDNLILDNMKLAYYLAYRYGSPYMDSEDFEQEALLALVKAANSYTGEGIPFSVYAGKYIYYRLLELRTKVSKQNIRSLSIDENISTNYDAITLKEVLIDESVNIEEERSDNSAISYLFSSLKEGDIELLKRRFVYCERYTEIADDIGVSRQFVNKKVRDLLTRMKNSLETCSYSDLN